MSTLPTHFKFEYVEYCSVLGRYLHEEYQTGEYLVTEDELANLVRYYDSEEIKISTAYMDGGVDPLWPRFERAALNQITGGDAAFCRYAIWANTLRDNLLEALESLGQDKREVKRLLTRVINNLSAFSDIQNAVDPFREDDA